MFACISTLPWSFCWLQQLEDALLQCGDLLDLVALTQGLQDGHLDIYGNYYNNILLPIILCYYYYVNFSCIECNFIRPSYVTLTLRVV
jgi:hypothetical protein